MSQLIKQILFPGSLTESELVEVRMISRTPGDVPSEHTPTRDPAAGPPPLPIEEVTGLSLEAIVEQFSGENNSACFTTPRQLWDG